MIKVEVLRDKKLVKTLVVKDHAGYSPSGQDLVCAGASSIVVGMMNALDLMQSGACELEVKEGYTRIQVICEGHGVQMLLEAMLIQLKTMVEAYPDYITISEQEV